MPKYQPSQHTFEKYANVLVNFALNSGNGIKKGEVVRISASESAKPLFIELRKAVLKAGGHFISQYLPDDEKSLNPSRDFFELASDEQLKFYPKAYVQGLVKQIDHSIAIISEVNKQALKGIDPAKIMTAQLAQKPWRELLDIKENQGKFTWTLALYATPQMAKEAGLSLEDYWEQIIKGCYLNQKDPIKAWQQTFAQSEIIIKKLNQLPIDTLHVKGSDVDLLISLGEKRQWAGGSGRNIPSFEIFTSPDWRDTHGWIKFNQPLYRYGNLIKGVELEFAKGKVVKAKASQNEKVLLEMIKTPNADKIGEFSLTDKRFSKITKFMAETLFDENVGGPQGNTHIALGKSYHDCYAGDPGKVTKAQWKSLGFNDSAVHTDIVSTTKRTVTAVLKNGSKKIIYDNGEFVI